MENETKKMLLRAVKIAVGSSIAIAAAEALQLEYAASAGSIALLTVMTSKWDTVKLSLMRIVTFILTVMLGAITFTCFQSDWAAYGFCILGMVVLCEIAGWKSAISVNAVIGTHFLANRDFPPEFIINEFLLVLIGISVALILNLYHANRSSRRALISNMRYTEEKMQAILGEFAAYLSNRPMGETVWTDLRQMEEKLQCFIVEAVEYQNNTFQSHPGYYIDYFEMRSYQCMVLRSLHSEVRRMRTMPVQAAVVADYILYLRPFVVEVNAPDAQIEKLDRIFEEMKDQPLPKSREEFESRALLYHVLMDLEEFLVLKKKFVEGLQPGIRKRYWSDSGRE